MRDVSVSVGRVSVYFQGEVLDASEGAISTDTALLSVRPLSLFCVVVAIFISTLHDMSIVYRYLLFPCFHVPCCCYVCLQVGYILLIAYATVVMTRRSGVHSNGTMATVSFIAVGMSIVCMWSLGLIFGLDFSLVVQASFFLLAGLGIDDTFVIMAAYRESNFKLRPKIRIQRALSIAGVSITLTSLTDAVAFGAGTFTSLPAIQSFCIFTLIGVLFDFMFQVTFVSAVLYLHAVRERDGRYDLLPCIKSSSPDKQSCSNQEFDHDSQGIAEKIFGVYLPKLILHPAGKVIVLVLAAGLAGSSIYAATLVPSEFSITFLVPSDSPVQDALDVLDHFGGHPVFSSVYTGPSQYGYDNVTTQEEMIVLSMELLGSPYFSTCDNWWTVFQAYVQASSPGNITMDGIINEDAFYPLLDVFFLSENGGKVSNFVVFNGTQLIQYSQIQCQFAETGKLGAKINSMLEIRSIASSHPLLGGPTITTARGEVEFPFAYNFAHLFFDGLVVVKEETLRNVLIAFVAVGVMSTLLLANLRAVFVVAMMLALVDANVLGFMYYTGVDFDTVSAINLVIAVGLAIDSSVHIAHAFLVSHGTKTERAAKALKKLGSSVFHGNFSTFLAILPLVIAKSFIFQVFFKVLSLILFFAILHGLVVLPVILSLVGPDPYPEKILDDCQEDTFTIEMFDSEHGRYFIENKKLEEGSRIALEERDRTVVLDFDEEEIWS
eukprot:m.141387 g.141387  ORF g.141387 m.141387 type:complete len:719 (-) comp13195_c0_seq2:295-2451(-)